MSATNATTNYELPVFIATDKPAWLTDWNGAMNAIDTAIHTAQSTADNAATTAGTATTDIATINNSLTTITGNITSLTTSVNGNTAAINTINSLIGNGEPTTTDKTLIGAINEIYGMITGGSNPVEADHVAYDNTTSGLTATNVQDAIDEIADPDAADVSYSNTASGLTATTVQAAIDEIAAGGGSGIDLDMSAYTGSATLTPNNATIDSDRTVCRYALTADKKYGKIYGYVQLTTTAVITHNIWTKVADISSNDLPSPATAYNVEVGFMPVLSSSTWSYVPCRFVFNTNGTVSVEVYKGGSEDIASGSSIILSFTPCIYQFIGFGD